MKKKRINYFTIIIWLVTGIFFGIVISLMAVTESHSLNQFYNGGEVYDLRYPEREADADGFVYSQAENRFEITKEEAHKPFSLLKKGFPWKYVVMDISQVRTEGIDAKILCFTAEGGYAGEKEVHLVNGRNVIELEATAFSAVDFGITGQAGAAISFDKVQFREKLLSFSKGRFAAFFSLTLVFYVLLSGLLIRFHQKKGRKFDWYAPVAWLQDLYILIGEKTGQFTAGIGAKARGRIRAGLFLFLILYMQVAADFSFYESVHYYKFNMLLGSAVVFIIALLCREKKLVRIPWRNKMVGAWMILWCMACVSDFLVGKRYAFLGYIMLFGIGFLYFSWHNMPDRGQLMQEFITAVRVSFFLILPFCLLCRPLKEGVRYTGSYVNPGMFAMYLLFVWIAFLSSLHQKISQRKISPWVILDMACISFCGWLLWKTQSSSGLLPAAFAAVLFLFLQFVLSRSKPMTRRAVVFCVLTAVLSVPFVKAGEWGFTHIPYLLDTEVQMPKDYEAPAYASSFFAPETVYAAGDGNIAGDGDAVYGNTISGGIRESRIIKKLFGKQSFEKITSLRNLYWIGYLRETNLFGHEFKTRLWNSNRWPHNGFIAIIYRYGLFAVIPYTVLVILNLVYSWRYLRRHADAQGFFLFSVMASSFYLILIENLELPFFFLCWQAMYFMMGINFVQKNDIQIEGSYDQ